MTQSERIQTDDIISSLFAELKIVDEIYENAQKQVKYMKGRKIKLADEILKLRDMK